tara:strand:+ start:11637 stop:11939 length:303 start_codon:yes stop_codon:yes gene_type:complete
MENSNPTLKEEVEPTSPIKEWLVNYVGDSHSPNDGNVTVEMIVETLAKEFPEFVLAVAEENWIRGYQQGIEDVNSGFKWSSASGNNSDPTLGSEADETKA